MCFIKNVQKVSEIFHRRKHPIAVKQLKQLIHMRSGWITGLFLSRNFVKFFRAAIPLKIYRQVSEPVIHKYSEEKMFWNSCKCSTFSTVELFCRPQPASL